MATINILARAPEFLQARFNPIFQATLLCADFYPVLKIPYNRADDHKISLRSFGKTGGKPRPVMSDCGKLV